jgi:hypothetical protein
MFHCLGGGSSLGSCLDLPWESPVKECLLVLSFPVSFGDLTFFCQG